MVKAVRNLSQQWWRKTIRKREVAICYVAPKTRPWNEINYAAVINDTIYSLADILEKRRKTVITGDFNCKEEHWEEMFTEGKEDSWGNELLEMTMEYTISEQRGDIETRFTVHNGTKYRG